MIPTNQKAVHKNFSLSNITRCRLECYMLSSRSLPLAAHSHVEKFTKYSDRIALCSVPEIKKNWERKIIWRTTKSFSKHLSRFAIRHKKRRERESIEMTTRWEFCLFMTFPFVTFAMHFLGGSYSALPNRRRSTIRCARFSF